MEHAQAHGINCHRDIKPANILITQEGTLKIGDFGLAAAAEVAWRGMGGPGGSLVTHDPEGSFGFSLMQTGGKARCGTPGYMAPEVNRGEGADIRSDIYSFGLVLWQMVTGSPMPPFVAPYRGDLEGYLRQIYEQQMTGRVPGVDGFLGPVIERCLRPMPAERYGDFAELRRALEPILERKTGKKIEVPQVEEKTAAFWNYKGGSLATLGRRAEAMSCYDQALALDPRAAGAWSNKGNALDELGRQAEAISCYGQALALDPRDAKAWNNKGLALAELGRRAEAIGCYDQALVIDPRYAQAWNSKGAALAALGRRTEAISCHDAALAIDPRYAPAWNNKGLALAALGQRAEAISCYDQALAIDPRLAQAWNNKGNALAGLGRRAEAISCFEQALAIDPRHAGVWYNKGKQLAQLHREEKAIECYNKALAVDPELAVARDGKCLALVDLALRENRADKYAEAIDWLDKALEIDPRNPLAWHIKAICEEALGHWPEAARGYRKFIELAPAEEAEEVANARQQLLDLESEGT